MATTPQPVCVFVTSGTFDKQYDELASTLAFTETQVPESALSFAQVLAEGVYLAINGRSFAWDSVRKNRETGIFEAL